jgi:hypothetical protein
MLTIPLFFSSVIRFSFGSIGLTANDDKIDRHYDSDQCEKKRDCDRLCGGMRVRGITAVEPADQLQVVRSRKNVHRNANGDQSGAKPE